MRKADNPIKERTVKRYFYNGKGYPTKRKAYEAKAKRMLIEMVLGPAEDYSCIIDDRGNSYDYVGLAWCEEQRRHTTKEEIDARFAEFFPHKFGRKEAGCCDRNPDRSEPRCAGNWDQDDWFEDLEFASCRTAQYRWVRKKAQELMEQDKEQQP